MNNLFNNNNESYVKNMEPFVSIHIKLDGAVHIQNENVKVFNQKSITVLSLLHDSHKIYPSSTSDEIAMHVNGIVIYEGNDYIKIFTDPFRTIPLFYCEYEGIFICSDIRSCLKLSYDGNIDVTGFWELIKYGICIGNRTLYKKVKQIPGASYLKVKKETFEYNIIEYWNYCIPANPTIFSMGYAIKHLDDLLNSTIKRNISVSNYDNYIMGLSGGLDSRLSLNYLSQHLGLENLYLFTFGADKKTLEYQYAKQVSELCNLSTPVFCKLIDQTYIDSINGLSTQTAGHINLIHGHISYSLTHYFNKTYNACQISNYFSDAIFGYSCINPREDLRVGFNNMKHEILGDKVIPSKIRYNIIDDLKIVFNRCHGEIRESNNYSSFFEYFYMAEKNIKLHSYLMHNQSSILPTLAPYTDVDLVKFMISIPIEFRRGKDIVAELIDTVSIFKGKRIGDISSRDFNRATNKLDWFSFYGFKFRSVNRINIILDILTSGKLRLNNKQLTEDIQGVYHRVFRKKMKQANRFLVERGVLNEASALNRFRQIRLRPAAVGENMQLLSIVEGVRSLEDEFNKINS